MTYSSFATYACTHTCRARSNFNNNGNTRVYNNQTPKVSNNSIGTSSCMVANVNRRLKEINGVESFYQNYESISQKISEMSETELTKFYDTLNNYPMLFKNLAENNALVPNQNNSKEETTPKETKPKETKPKGTSENIENFIPANSVTVKDEAGDGYKTVTIVNNTEYKNYKQGEFSYNGTSMIESGCGPTALAVALQGVGVNITPDKVAEDLNKTNAWNLSDGMAKGYTGFDSITDKNGNYKGANLNVIDYDSDNASEMISQALKDGNPVILNTRPNTYSPGNHYIVALGFDKNNDMIISNVGGGINLNSSNSNEILAGQYGNYNPKSVTVDEFLKEYARLDGGAIIVSGAKPN